MNEIKKEIKLLYTFIILFIFCAFLLLFNIVLILSKNIDKENTKDFEKISSSVVSVHSYSGHTLDRQGSGFIYKVNKDNAYILTNNHVVENSTNYKVYISENESITAHLLGYDKYLDVAVLSIENNGYKALKLNNKNELNIGDVVYTMGTPINNEFFNSTSSGIVSNPSRLRIEENSNEQILMDMIQSNMVTSPGNSGGPLLNKDLEVIGICTSNIDTNNHINGITYAVPINHVINKLNELEKEGQTPERKISNIEIVDIKDSEVLYKNNLIDITKEPYGVVVLENDKETSLKKGDIILEIDNNKTKDINHYKHYLNIYSKNEKVNLKIKRNNKEKIIKVIIK